jgi:NAD(P)-dependent dehydrogenase (short-subunit alcohol dehydrogenase family)
LGLILAALFAIDWMTGEEWWVQWPAIGMALWLASDESRRVAGQTFIIDGGVI